MAPNGTGMENGLKPFTLPKNREFKGGDLLAQSLLQLGVKVAFGLHGGHLDAFLMGAHDAGIEIVDTRHETVAVQAAEGYSKVSREVGVCFATANSGFGNAIPGLQTAYADRSSIFCITSSSPQRDAETNVLQGFHDQIVVAKPFTRFAYRVVHAEEIPRLVSHAIHVATASPPGPILIDFPIEVLFSPVEQSLLSLGSIKSPQPYPPGPHPEAIGKAVELLKASQRPAIVTGTGARWLEGDKNFLSFVETANIPVFHSMKYSGSLPFRHPLRAGVANSLSALPAIGKSSPDLVLLLGARTGMFMGSRSKPCLPKIDCKYIQVDVDGGEIGRSIPIDVGITSDVRPAVAALAAALDGYRASNDWTESALALKSLPQPHEKEAEVFEPGTIHPYHALKRAFGALPEGAILSVDGGDIGSWTVSTQEFARPSNLIFSCGYLGMLGSGWGYCLGASFADPNRIIVNIQGDGSAGLHLMEIDTYARFGCKILTIVGNNHCWGMSTNGQEIIYGSYTDARPAASLSPSMDFSKVAEGLNCASLKVNKPGDVQGAVQKLIQEVEAGKPALLEILTSRTPIHPGTISSVGFDKDENVVVIPYYDNVRRPYYK